MRAQTVLQKRGRDRLSIIAEILDITLHGSLKTQIMYRANLSFAQLNDYLSFLSKSNLLEKVETKGKTFFKSTQKGILFLKNYREIKGLLTPESVEEAIGKPSIVAVIPAYNEEPSIAEAILKVQNQVDRVIVCDDGSTDMTPEIAERMGAKVVRHKKTRGKGAAVRSALRETKELGADVVVIIDADEQYASNEISKLIQPILSGQVDFVIGARTSEDELRRNIPLYRRLGDKAVAKLFEILTGKRLSDVTCGFRAISGKALDAFEISGKEVNVDVELLMQAHSKGFRIVEVPIECEYYRPIKPSRKIQVPEK